MSILELTAVELGKKIKDKEITVVEATKAALEQIKQSKVMYMDMSLTMKKVH